MGLPAISIGVTVERGKDKKGKKKKNVNIMENEKITNYDLLKKLGFDKEFLEGNKRFG